MNRKLSRILATALLATFVSAPAFAQKITSFTRLTDEARTYEKVEFDIDVNADFTNPYDSKEVKMDMYITNPSGKRQILPCYWEGDRQWKARYSPAETGEYSCYVQLKSRKGSSRSKSLHFTVSASDHDGFITEVGPWTLNFDTGKKIRGIGENINRDPRPGKNPKYTYDYLLPKLAANGVNFIRTWLQSSTYPNEWRWNESSKDFKGHKDQWSNNTLYRDPIQRLDQIVELFEKYNVYNMMAIDAHGSFIAGSGWDSNPYNAINGGPCEKPGDFFTSPEAKARYKDRLRYLVARWGYSRSVAFWEFWNEVDNAQYQGTQVIRPTIPSRDITDWHQEMATYLKSIDPYKHLVTTSVSHRLIEGIFDMKDMDLNQIHIYRNIDSIPKLIRTATTLWEKPYVIGEFGFDWDWNNLDHSIGFFFDFDLRRGLWYGAFNQTPIYPMTWWWEFFDERNMNWIYKSVSTITNRMMAAGGATFEKVPVRTSIRGLESYAVKCGEEIYVYILNPLFERAYRFEIEVGGADAADYQVEEYNTQRMEFRTLETKNTINNHKISFSPLTVMPWDDRVYILTPKK